MTLTLVILLVLLLCFAALSIAYWTFINGISPMPTSPRAMRRMRQLLPRNTLEKGSPAKIYELGSGWGTVVFMLAQFYPNGRVVGYETSLFPYYFSKLILKIKKLSNAEIRRQDFYSLNLSDAELIVCYLFPKAMEKLSVKFSKELKSGTCIISHTFAIPGWKPESTIVIEDIYHTRIYLYLVSTTWEL